ncbi:MAG: potassium-transporting ATPase subunit KdpA [Thermoplasmata archaeon]|nr:potassium-transporting ATPase subunit KdpA [Thermoplasmata archaeon]
MPYYSLASVADVALTLGIGLLVAIPLGRYMAKVYQGRPTMWDPVFLPIERVIYRGLGVNPRRSMGWKEYFVALLAVNLAAFVFLYLLLVDQQLLPLNALGAPNMDWTLAFHTSAAFLTNTDYQHYSGESQVSLLASLFGLQLMFFLSAATGLAVVVAFIRGFTRKDGSLGNFWVDLTRSFVWILLPISVVGAVLLALAGIPETFHQSILLPLVGGGTQTTPVGPLASWDSIEWLGSNGGGFFGANGGHPLQNPNAITNMMAIVLMMAIPFGTPVLFGNMIRKPGEALPLLATILVIFLIALGLFLYFQASYPFLAGNGVPVGQGNGYTLGAEARFTLPESDLFQVTSIYSNVGATSMSLGALTPGAQMVLLWGMFLQSVPGGVGTGFGTLLLEALLAIFVGGLMVGRTPEYIGKKLNRDTIKWAALAILSHPFAILIPLAVAYVLGYGVAAGGISSHAFTVILYEFTSESANNGSGSGPINDATPFFNLAGAAIMLFGRYVPILAMLASAGALSRQTPLPPGPGTLRTESPTFTVYMILFIVVMTGLLFLPVLALGPFAQGVP